MGFDVELVTDSPVISPEEMAREFPAADARAIRNLWEKLRKNPPEDRTIVDKTGSPMWVSSYSGWDVGREIHDNLLDV